MTPEFCKCGEERLNAHTPFVAYQDELHTPERCGFFLRPTIDASKAMGVGRKPSLNVQWPPIFRESRS